MILFAMTSPGRSHPADFDYRLSFAKILLKAGIELEESNPSSPRVDLIRLKIFTTLREVEGLPHAQALWYLNTITRLLPRDNGCEQIDEMCKKKATELSLDVETLALNGQAHGLRKEESVRENVSLQNRATTIDLLVFEVIGSEVDQASKASVATELSW